MKIAIGLLALIIVPLAAEVRTVDSAEALFLGGGLFLRLSRHRGLKPTVVHS